MRKQRPLVLTAEEIEESGRLIGSLDSCSVDFLKKLNSDLVTLIRGKINQENLKAFIKLKVGDKVKFTGAGKKLLGPGATGKIISLGRGRVRVDFGEPVGLWIIYPKNLEVVK